MERLELPESDFKRWWSSVYSIFEMSWSGICNSGTNHPASKLSSYLNTEYNQILIAIKSPHIKNKTVTAATPN